MPFTPASGPSVSAFVLVVLFVLTAFVAAVWRAYRDRPPTRARVIALAFIYLIPVGVAVDVNVLPMLPLSGIPVFFGVVLAVSLGVASSPACSRCTCRMRMSGRCVSAVRSSAMSC